MPKVINKQKLEKAISYARKYFLKSKSHIVTYFEVSQVTLCRRVAGTQAIQRETNYDQQPFDHGEDKAIAEHCLIMANWGFALTFDFLY